MIRLSQAFSLLILLVFLPQSAAAFDMTGLQPVSPNGVFSTFSTYSLQRQGMAVEIAFERSHEPDFYRYSLRGAYGLTDTVELLINIPYVNNFNDHKDGIEDIAFGMKHRFYDEGKYGPSLAYLLQAAIDTGKSPFSTDGNVGLGFIMSKRVGPVRGHVNFLYKYPGNKRLNDEITLAGGIEFSAAHNFDLLGEVIARRGYVNNEFDNIEARLGSRIKTTDSIFTTVGIGVDMKDRSPEYRFIVLVSFVSPTEKKKITRIYEEEQ